MKPLPRSLTLSLAALMLAGVALTGCAGRSATPPPAPAASPTAKPFAGQSIRFLAANHPWTDAIKKLIPEFESQTGAKVNIESITENDLTTKLTVELTAGSGSVDVFMQRPLQEAKLFGKNGWYADLAPYISDGKKTPADWNVADFFPGAMDVEKQGAKIVGVPIVTEQEIVYYRKDLFAAKGVKVPTTMAELETAAKALHDPANGFYGIVMRGAGNPATTQFSSFLYSFGGDFIKDGKFVLDSPEAVRAATFYGNLLGKYGPQGVLNMNWPQAAPIFAQGKAAMWIDADSLFKEVTDPAKSQVGDKVGFAMIPAGDKGALPYSVTSWGLSIANSSQHKDLAWAFVNWATSKANTLQIQGTGVPSARTSVWNDPAGTKAWPAEWVDAAKKSGAVGKPADRPLVIDVGHARDYVGEIITAAITGKDVAAQARTSNAKLNDLLASEAK